MLVAVAVYIALAAWAMASPPGSAPDDDYHLASIMCGHGEVTGRCGAGDDAITRTVPDEATSDFICYRFVGDESAACQDRYDGVIAEDTTTGSGNWTGGYPPVFYFLASFLVTSHIDSTVLVVRGASIAVVVGVLAALHLALPRRRRPLATVPLLVCSVPLGSFLMSSTNPSGWAVVSAAVVWISLLGALETTGRRRWALCVLAGAGTLMGAGSRGDSAAFVVVAVVVVAILRLDALRSLSSIRTHLPALATAVGSTAMATAFFLSSGQAGALQTGFAPNTSDLSWTALARINVANLPTIWLGALGSGSLNQLSWLDIGMPPLLGFTCVGVLATVLVLSLRGLRRERAAAVALVVLVLAVFPLYLLGRSGLQVGAGFQPRYVLPLLVLLAGVCMLGRRGTSFEIGRVHAMVLALALGVANSTALFIVERRFVTGFDVSTFDLDRGVEWWWGGPLSPLTIWVLGSLAFLVAAAAILSQCTTLQGATADATTTPPGARHPRALDTQADGYRDGREMSDR